MGPDMLRDPVMVVFPITCSEPVISAEPVKGKPEEDGKFVKPLPSPAKNEAVTALVTSSEFKKASEPDTITFFQLGIYICLLRLVAANVCCPLPLRAYNIAINIGYFVPSYSLLVLYFKSTSCF